MLKTKLTHLGILAMLGCMGHGSMVLIADGNTLSAHIPTRLQRTSSSTCDPGWSQ